MRTTLNLDDRAAVAARARARTQGITFGESVSQLVLAGLAAEQSATRQQRSTITLLPPAPGHVITNEMVADALEDE